MTEIEWLNATEPKSMLQAIADIVHPRVKHKVSSSRLCRLVAVACFNDIIHLMSEPWMRQGLTLAERLADDWSGNSAERTQYFRETKKYFLPRDCDDTNYHHSVTFRMMQSLSGLLEHRNWFNPEMARTVIGVIHELLVPHTYEVVEDEEIAVERPSLSPMSQEELHLLVASQVSHIHDVFGNLFRVPRFDKSWLTCNASLIPRFAHAIYQDKAFDRMPILADALEEAGCTDVDILLHCRRDLKHVRGCWVLDLCMKK